MRYGMVLVTVDSEEKAHELVDCVLESRLAACVQMVPIKSYYIWQGKKEHSSEILLMMKTKRRFFSRLEKLVKEHHPYEVPEIVFVPFLGIFGAYRKWMDDVLWRKN